MTTTSSAWLSACEVKRAASARSWPGGRSTRATGPTLRRPPDRHISTRLSLGWNPSMVGTTASSPAGPLTRIGVASSVVVMLTTVAVRTTGQPTQQKVVDENRSWEQIGGVSDPLRTAVPRLNEQIRHLHRGAVASCSEPAPQAISIESGPPAEFLQVDPTIDHRHLFGPEPTDLLGGQMGRRSAVGPDHPVPRGVVIRELGQHESGQPG
jgi:hypothetical protein